MKEYTFKLFYRQISQLLDESKRAPVSLQQIETQTSQRKSSVIHAPIPAPPADDMEPQNISFIGNTDKLSEGKKHLKEKYNVNSDSYYYFFSTGICFIYICTEK